jgi:hypothetical protein
LITVTKPALLCDTGLLSRVFLAKSQFFEASQTATQYFQETIITPVFIELQHWLLIQRGLVMLKPRVEYDRNRKRLDNYIVLNSDGVSEQALSVARRWPTQAWVMPTQ